MFWYLIWKGYHHWETVIRVIRHGFGMGSIHIGSFCFSVMKEILFSFSHNVTEIEVLKHYHAMLNWASNGLSFSKLTGYVTNPQKIKLTRYVICERLMLWTAHMRQNYVMCSVWEVKAQVNKRKWGSKTPDERYVMNLLSVLPTHNYICWTLWSLAHVIEASTLL